MRTAPDAAPELGFHPLTPERWPDLERLFGPRGACAGCWCMFWRLPKAKYREQKGDANREEFRGIVDSGRVPGILACAYGEPVGWCAVEPREAYPALERTSDPKPVDDQPVWSVTCFYVARGWRRRGVTAGLLRAAVEHVRRQGGRVVEGCPVEPRGDARAPSGSVWTGFAAAFRQAGFVEVARRAETRPIMRCLIGGEDGRGRDRLGNQWT